MKELNLRPYENQDDVPLAEVLNMVHKKFKDTFFYLGLSDNLQKAIRPRLSEVKDGTITMEQLALEYENPSNKTKPLAAANPQTGKDNTSAVMEQLCNLDLSQVNPTVAAEINAIRDRNYRGGRGGGGRGGRGGGQQRGGGGGGNGNPNTAPGKQKYGMPPLAEIQKRQRPIYCSKCQNWGKHFARECRRTDQEISLLEMDDKSVIPEGGAKLTDSLYDGRSSMPPDPASKN